MSDERTHPVRLGDRESLPVMSSTAVAIEPVRMGSKIAQEPQGVGCEPRLALCGFDREPGEALRLVQTSEQQAGATDRVVGPPSMTADSPGDLTVEEVLTFANPAQRLVRLPELCQRPR